MMRFLFYLVCLVAIAGSVLWWRSPAHRILGEWVTEGSLVPVSQTVNFSAGGKCTMTTGVSLGGKAAIGSSREMTYTLHTDHEPYTIEFGAGPLDMDTHAVPEPVAFKFLNADTIQVQRSMGGGALSLSVNSTWKRKK
jgi:hypothetical protein